MLINELIHDFNMLNWDKVADWGQEGLMHHHKQFDFPTIVDIGWKCIVWKTDKCGKEFGAPTDVDMYAYVVVHAPHWEKV